MNIIEFRTHDNQGFISINTNKIAGLSAKDDKTTSIFITCEQETDEWIVGEPYLLVAEKLRMSD